MGGGNAQGFGILGYIHAGFVFGLDHFGKPCGQALGRIGGFVFSLVQQDLAAHPDGQQAGVVVDGTHTFGLAAFQFALQIVQNAGDFGLRIRIADAQVGGHDRQGKAQIARDEDGGAEHLCRHLETMHHTGRNEYRIMCAITARGAGNGDTPLTTGKP